MDKEIEKITENLEKFTIANDVASLEIELDRLANLKLDNDTDFAINEKHFLEIINLKNDKLNEKVAKSISEFCKISTFRRKFTTQDIVVELIKLLNFYMSKGDEGISNLIQINRAIGEF